jgi:hypothetical protein
MKVFGRWTSEIARRLAQNPNGFFLNDVLGSEHTWPEYTALHRAAGLLEASGIIKTSLKNEGGKARTWITRGRKRPELPPYIMATLRLPQTAAKE